MEWRRDFWRCALCGSLSSGWKPIYESKCLFLACGPTFHYYGEVGAGWAEVQLGHFLAVILNSVLKHFQGKSSRPDTELQAAMD